MNFEATIGLEIHVEMKTKSKMFSTSPVTFGELPNTMIAPLDMAFPGTLPVVNKQAVIDAIRVCNALHMSIDDLLIFDRKNYFYSDLPKGYQITQQDHPIGREGYLCIDVEGHEKRINIERLHMEEDTCKQLHSWDCTLLDYNRAGIPLIEIVSKPEMTTGEEARKYAEKIRSIVSFLDVSDGKMEEGSLRCDVNISIKPIGSKVFGTKVEIKNLNSFVNIEKAIDFEIKRQTEVLLSGGKVIQETRRFDEATKETVTMRLKTDSVDYKYFTEPNIVPIRLSKEFIESAIKSSPELAEEKMARYQSLGLNEYDSRLLVANKDNAEYFDDLVKKGANAKMAANWVIVDIQSILNKNEISIKDFIVTTDNLAKLLKNIEQGKISNNQAREIFAKMQVDNKDCEELIAASGTNLISDEAVIHQMVVELIDNNPQAVIDYKNGKTRAVGYLVGLIMKASKGKINPSITNKMIVEELNKR